MLKREAHVNGFDHQSQPDNGDRLRALVRDAAAGDNAAWTQLVARYDRLVRHVVRAHGIDVATSEDIVQVTWCRLVQNLDRVRQPERLGAGSRGPPATSACRLRGSGRERRSRRKRCEP